MTEIVDSGKEIVEAATFTVGGSDEPLENASPLAQIGCSSGAPSLGRSLIVGVCSLGGAFAIERGASFLSNLLAARFAGASTFGAYSIALTTANNVASYAGAGIGYTATRFTAEHAPGSEGRERVLRSLSLFAVLSASLAGVLLWMGASPLAASFLRNRALERPLKIAALSAAAFVLLECCRGVFIGTRSFVPLFLLSCVLGAGLLLAVPSLAHLGATSMVTGQVGAVVAAVLVSVFLIAWRRAPKPKPLSREVEKTSLGAVWRFGLVQLGGVVGLNAAGWWTASLVARGDSSLLQMAFYSVATQWRNLSALLPGMVPQGNFAFFTDQGAADFGGASRVITVSSIFSSALAILCSGIVILPIPFVLRHFYGQGYAAAELPTAFAIATALVHMGMSPAASRLTVLSLRWTGGINLVWSLFVLVVGTLLIPSWGATAATATLFAAHVLSVILVLFAFKRLGSLSTGLVGIAILDIAVAVAFGSLSWARATHPHYAVTADLLLIAVTTFGAMLLLRLGQSCGALPKQIDWTSMLESALATLRLKSVRAMMRPA